MIYKIAIVNNDKPRIFITKTDHLLIVSLVKDTRKWTISQRLTQRLAHRLTQRLTNIDQQRD